MTQDDPKPQPVGIVTIPYLLTEREAEELRRRWRRHLTLPHGFLSPGPKTDK